VIKQPSAATLKRYGLTVDSWRALGDEQGWCCYVCEKEPSTGRLVIDHEHVKGWKHMPAEERVKHVRGMLCFFCNHYYVGRSINVRKARRVMEYLMRHEARKIQASGQLTPRT
jgi:hypothetical protein